jgi:hypothetical protein
MSEHKQTAEEIFDSLTGFDEMAITQHFGRTIGDLASNDESMFSRALLFTVKRREGLADDDARNFALGMTLGENIAYFADTTEKDAEEEAGKDEQPEEQPATSLSSVS